jgi:hypothetical protein
MHMDFGQGWDYSIYKPFKTHNHFTVIISSILEALKWTYHDSGLQQMTIGKWQ